MLFPLSFLMGSFRLCWLMCERPQSWFLSKAENHLKILDSIRTKGWLCLEQAFKSLPSVSTRGHRTKHTISPQTSPCWKQDILTFTAELCQLVCYTYISCVCPRPESEQGDSSLPCSLMTWVEGESCVISCFFMTSIKEASPGWVLSSTLSIICSLCLVFKCLCSLISTEPFEQILLAYSRSTNKSLLENQSWIPSDCGGFCTL